VKFRNQIILIKKRENERSAEHFLYLTNKIIIHLYAMVISKSNSNSFYMIDLHAFDNIYIVFGEMIRYFLKRKVYNRCNKLK